MTSQQPPQGSGSGRQPIPPPKRKRLQQCFEKANRLMGQGEHDYADELFTQCVLGDPANMVYAQSFLGNLRQKYDNNKKGSKLAFLKGAGTRGMIKKAHLRKDWDAVFKSGLEALKLNPWDVPTLKAMAEACQELECDEAQMVYLKIALDTSPTDTVVNRLCAIALTERKQYDQAIACWHRIMKARPDDPEPQRAIAGLAAEKTIAKGGYEQSDSKAKQVTQKDQVQANRLTPEETLEIQIKRHPEDLSKYLELAELHLRAERFAEAEDVFARAYQASNDDDVHEKWEDAQMRHLRQQYAAAEREAQKAETDEAKACLNKLLEKINSKDLEIHLHRCQRYPNNLALKYRLGYLYQKNGQLNEAIQQYQQARNDPTHHGMCMLMLGQCFQQIKQYRLAMTHYETATREIPEREEDSRKEALYLAARLAYRLKDCEAAERHATTLAELDFSYKDVPTLLDKIAKMREDGP